MLTTEEKARIRSEEIFRAEIRNELGPKPAPVSHVSFKKKLWEFLNSTFGLWFLSSVILAGVANWYTNKQAEIRENEKRQERAQLEAQATAAIRQRLLLEISYRFSATLSRLRETYQAYGTTVTPASQKEIIRALEIMEKPSDDTFPALFVEHKTFSGLALIAELHRHVPDVEKTNLTTILRDTSIFIKEQASSRESAETVARGLLQRLRYPQWNFLGFPYTTCPNENPFC